MSKFPRLADTSFPDLKTVNTYKAAPTFDYSRYDSVQMKVTVTNVPWDMGEVHVGQRTIGGIGNVVKFESDQARDAWFAAIDPGKKHVFETRFRKFHADDEIRLPLPFDMAARFNYVMVEYPVLPGDGGEPLPYEGYDGVRKWFYFIRSVEEESPNCTIAHIKRDTWQTFINHVNFSYMFVERGHCAFTDEDNFTLLSVDDFLESPITKNEKLLSPDLNFGEPTNVKTQDALVLNDGQMYACFATSADPTGAWGTKAANNWQVPALSAYENQGAPSSYVFAVPAEGYLNFLAAVDHAAPQFKQTVLCVFFAPAKLLTLGAKFVFCATDCYQVNASQKTLAFLDITKDKFGYDSRYEDLPKLYCSPYAHIEVTADDGASMRINVEDTSGRLDMRATLSLAYPWVNIDAYLTGVGSGNVGTLTFKNIDTHGFTYGGKWYDMAHNWKVPTFAIYQSPAKNNDYSTHYSRAQQKVEYDTNYTNADNSATNTTSNNAVTVAASNAMVATTNAANTTGAGYTDSKLRTDVQYDIGNSNAAFDAEMAQLGVAATNNDAQALASGVNTAVGALSQFASGPQNFGNAIASAITGAVSTGVNWQTANASITVSQSNNVSVYNQAVTSAYGKQDSAIWFTDTSTALSNSTQSTNTTTQNNAATSIAANNASLVRTNAGNSRSAAESAVSNQISQAEIGAPSSFGNYAGGDTATTRPQGLFASVVTQSRAAIRQAGDNFLRFGYYLNQAWEFEGFHIMPKFTYWKCADLLVKGLDVPDMYMDEIRFFLLGGVTVWRNPDDIGEVTIYENK